MISLIDHSCPLSSLLYKRINAPNSVGNSTSNSSMLDHNTYFDDENECELIDNNPTKSVPNIEIDSD